MMILEEKFILTPIETIMEEAVGACAVLGGGIETYPISEYVFQSVFLKMTGSQEQKLRCVMWYVSSFDYETRYKYLDKYKDMHQFSALGDKNKVYGLFREFVKRHDRSNVEIIDAVKVQMIRDTATSIARILGKSELREWNLKQYQEFKRWASGVTQGEVANRGELLAGALKDMHEDMVRNRNKYAHNSLSYQQNLPSMKSLVKGEESGNFYEWFFVLMLIDKVIMDRFKLMKVIIEQSA